jgi:ribosomal protein S18 acetylase RimI-like enzyme
VLIGTAEVSFDPSTRSSYLTLNPPVKCGYICNTAVVPEWRRRGVATHLMRALEDIAELAGEQAQPPALQ